VIFYFGLIVAVTIRRQRFPSELGSEDFLEIDAGTMAARPTPENLEVTETGDQVIPESRIAEAHVAGAAGAAFRFRSVRVELYSHCLADDPA
jgi:hypothetical protein